MCMVMALVSTSLLVGGCKDQKSYSDLLQDERKACNAYLAQHRVENGVPENNAFEVGPEAPYYRLDNEGNFYMQVLDAGDPDDMAQYDDLIYFRFMRMSVTDWYTYGDEYWSGNADDMTMAPTSFRYQNTMLSSTMQYGQGIQLPLAYLGMGCHVRILIKSQYGFADEIAYVTPFVFDIRYFRPQT